MVAAFKLTTQQGEMGWGGGRSSATPTTKAPSHPTPVMKRVENWGPRTATPQALVGKKLKVVNGADHDPESVIPFHDDKDSDVLRSF